MAGEIDTAGLEQALQFHGLQRKVEGQLGREEDKLDHSSAALKGGRQDILHMRVEHERELMNERIVQAGKVHHVSGDAKRALLAKLELMGGGNLQLTYRLLHKGHGAEVTYSEFRRMCDETFSLGLTEPEYRALFAEIDTANAGKLTIGNLIRAFAPAFAVAAETSFDATRPDTAEERKKAIVDAARARADVHVAAHGLGVDALLRDKLRQLGGEEIQSLFRKLHKGPGTAFPFDEFRALVEREFSMGLSPAEERELFAHIHKGDGDALGLDELRDFVSGPTVKHKLRTRLDGRQGAVAEVADGEDATTAAGLGLRVDAEAQKMKAQQADADKHGAEGAGAPRRSLAEARALLQAKMEEHAGGSAYQIFRLAHASAAPGAAHAAAVSFDEFKHVCAEFNMGLKGGELRALFDDLDRTRPRRIGCSRILLQAVALRSLIRS